MNREAIKYSAFIAQRIDPPRMEALERIPSCFGRWTDILEGFELRELCVRGVDLRRSVDPGKDHVAVFQDVVDFSGDGRIVRPGEERGAIAELDTIMDARFMT